MGSAVAAWTGWWRSWAANMLLRPFPITIAPPLGLLFAAYGVSSLVPELLVIVLGGIGMLGSVLAFVIGPADPRWFGPRWYRDFDRAPDLSVPANAMVAATQRVPTDRNSEQAALRDRGPPLGRWTASMVRTAPTDVVGGALLLYPTELVFAADRAHDALHPGPLVLARPTSTLTASVCGGGLRPDLVIGPGPDPWIVRSPRPRRLAAELTRRYGDTPENSELLP